MTSARNNCGMSFTKKGSHGVLSDNARTKGRASKCAFKTIPFVSCYPIFLSRKGVRIARALETFRFRPWQLH